MLIYNKFEKCCRITWKKGYKPEKAIETMSKALGYSPSMEDYKRASRKVILCELRRINEEV